MECNTIHVSFGFCPFLQAETSIMHTKWKQGLTELNIVFVHMLSGCYPCLLGFAFFLTSGDINYAVVIITQKLKKGLELKTVIVHLL